MCRFSLNLTLFMTKLRILVEYFLTLQTTLLNHKICAKKDEDEPTYTSSLLDNGIPPSTLQVGCGAPIRCLLEAISIVSANLLSNGILRLLRISLVWYSLNTSVGRICCTCNKSPEAAGTILVFMGSASSNRQRGRKLMAMEININTAATFQLGPSCLPSSPKSWSRHCPSN